MDSWFNELAESEEPQRILMYGKEGATKTTHALTMSAFGPVLAVNAEAGIKRVALKRQGLDVDQIKVWPKENDTVTIKSLRDVRDRVAADLMKDPKSWYGVAIDSISAISEVLLSQVTANRVRKETNRGMEPDPDFVDRADYGIMTKQVKELIRSFRDLPCHLIITALERREEDENTKKVSYVPAVTPALQLDLLGYVDVAMDVRAPDEDGPARALIRGKAAFRTKDRYGLLPDVFASPTFDRYMQYVNGELTAENDPVQKLLKVKKPTNTATAA